MAARETKSVFDLELEASSCAKRDLFVNDSSVFLMIWLEKSAVGQWDGLASCYQDCD